jgi:hypothetical protein
MNMNNRFLAAVPLALLAGACIVAGACIDDDLGPYNPPYNENSQGLIGNELSSLLMDTPKPITNTYMPKGGHAGIDFGSTGDGETSVLSPVDGTISANTSSCGKVAVFDGGNTIILAHMTARTSLPVGSKVTKGTYLGKASKVVGGGCSATAAHLHIEIRTGNNTSMALPSADNTKTTLDPLTYNYGPFPAPTITTPSVGSIVTSSPVTFNWTPLPGANTYRLQISSSNFSGDACSNGCVYDTAASSTSRSVSLGTGTWYFRVRAGNSGAGGYWSSVRSVIKK